MFQSLRARTEETLDRQQAGENDDSRTIKQLLSFMLTEKVLLNLNLKILLLLLKAATEENMRYSNFTDQESYVYVFYRVLL